MLKINRNKNKIKNSSELEIFLSTGMEVFSSQKKIDKNKDKTNIKEENNYKKIDELIENFEKTIKDKNIDKKDRENTKPYLEFVEIRSPIEKKPQTNKLDEKTIEKKQEITFNIKEDEKNIQELTFNVTKNENNKEIEKREKKKKKFFLFKNKKIKDKKIKIKDKKKEETDKINLQKNKEKSKENKDIENEKTLDEDIKKVLLITDNLLEKLPEDVINDFIKSKDFELYERIINKIK